MDNDEIKQKVLSKVLMFLAYRPRTRKEIGQRMGRYLKAQKSLGDEAKEEIARRIFDYLDQNRLVDDEAFAKLFIESKSKGKSVLGKRVILAKLMEKGISKSDAGLYLDVAVSEEDELNNAIKALTNRYKTVTIGGSTPSKEMHDKMGNYLLTKGFSYSTAKQAIDYLLKRS